MKVRDVKGLAREPVYSRTLVFGAPRSSFIPADSLKGLWKSTKLQKAHTEEHAFHGKIKVLDSCWHWAGPGGSDGLGKLYDRSVLWVSWYATNGPVPDWARFENVCGNPLCHNPVHHALIHDSKLEKFLKDCPELSDKNYPLPWGQVVEEPVEESLPVVKEVVNLQKIKIPKAPKVHAPRQTAPRQTAPKPPAPEVQADGEYCRNGHDIAVQGWYVFGGGKRRECRACKNERSRRATLAGA